jgi:hypothetical protein
MLSVDSSMENNLTKEVLHPRPRYRSRHSITKNKDVGSRLSEAELSPSFREAEGRIGGI